MSSRSIAYAAGICVLLSTAACGKKDQDTEAPPTGASSAQNEAKAPPPPPPPPAPPVPDVTLEPDAGGVVHLTGNDQMRFNANKIKVAAGKAFKVELKNIGTVPKQAMGHDFVLLKPGTDPQAFAMKAAAAAATDYIPADAADVLAHTKLLGPGESDTIEVANLAPGTYPFVCSFPAHYVFMKGELIVQ